MAKTIVTAQVVAEAGGMFGVIVNHDGPTVLTGESYAIASAVAEALVNPEAWAGSEIGEVAEAIRKRETVLS